jgi:hypothetical protein
VNKTTNNTDTLDTTISELNEIKNKNNTTKEGKIFLRNTYLHLAGGIGIFAGLQALLIQSGLAKALTIFIASLTPSLPLFLGIILGATLISIFNNTSRDSLSKINDKLGQYYYFATAILGNTFILTPIIYIASTITTAPILTLATIFTLALAGILGLSSFLLPSTEKGFAFLGILLLAGIAIAFSMFGAIIAAWFFGATLGLGYWIMGTILSSIFFLIQSFFINNKYIESSQYILAAADLFNALMDLFYFILRILIKIYSEKD